ncbi:MAG: histidine phosphatase family protein [Kangiellaceae bacterium]|nr:histidine phosphatase family protein [Kangiellaceae bacterium]MCW9001054.1 histidine phosphatase family protein [Kangiellaceae bacterium]MCW9018304.1 histidine phosphatase family protein [Kangiellaceae bacterium]
MSTTRLYLARHGETEWNLYRKLQGRLDSPLTEAGKQQAKRLGQKLLDEKVDKIYASPLGRASQTALRCKAILDVELEYIEELQERHFGDWQSSLFDDLDGHQNFQNVFFKVTLDSPPNGESGVACAQRIQKCLNTIVSQHKQQSVLVVTHGDAIRCFMSLITRESGVDAYSQYGNGKIFEMDFCHDANSFQLLRAF